MSENGSLTQDEKLMAALAHGSVILPFMGIIAPIVIWATQKEKSEYISFQALQAVAYQVILLIGWFLGMACYIGSFVISIIASIAGVAISALAAGAAEDSPLAVVLTMLFTMLPGFLPFLLFGVVILGALAFVTYGLVAGGMTLQGKDFRYIVIGRRVDNYIKQH